MTLCYPSIFTELSLDSIGRHSRGWWSSANLSFKSHFLLLSFSPPPTHTLWAASGISIFLNTPCTVLPSSLWVHAVPLPWSSSHVSAGPFNSSFKNDSKTISVKSSLIPTVGFKQDFRYAPQHLEGSCAENQLCCLLTICLQVHLLYSVGSSRKPVGVAHLSLFYAFSCFPTCSPNL